MKYAQTTVRVAISSLALLALPALVFAAPSTFFVDDNCNPPTTGSQNDPFCTIQEAVNQANNGDTIKVKPGIYNEPTVTVTKSVKILGAQAGNDATSRSVPLSKESVVNGSFNLQANNIQLNGFLVKDNASGPGVTTSPSFSGYNVSYNILRNNVFGLYLHSSGTIATNVSRNLFDANNQSGAAEGNAIYSDQGLHNATIERNKSTGHAGSALNLVKGDSVSSNNSDVTFERNESVKDGNMVNLYHSDEITISRNVARTIRDALVDGSAIYLAGDNHGVLISRNEIRDRSWTGIAIDNILLTPNTDVMIERNILRRLGNDGIDIRTDSVGMGEATVERNDVRQMTTHGITVATATAGLTFNRNSIHASGVLDADDNSAGAGTAGTANTWNRNDCSTDDPNGLCE